MKERNIFLTLAALFGFIYFVPFSSPKVSGAILESFYLLQDYVREHTLTCLIPALFIAGAMSIMISQASVVKYFGAKAKRVTAYGVASVSGSILAVCSCTVLPLFAGIYSRGAGIGPAIAFAYSGPAINILAIVLTARVLGAEMGIARALGSVVFAVTIGLIMALIFRDKAKTQSSPKRAQAARSPRSAGMTVLFFAVMSVGLVFATWAKPDSESGIIFSLIYSLKWYLAGLSLIATAVLAFTIMDGSERRTWMEETWSYSKMIIPLLFIGVLAAGFLLGRPGHEGVLNSSLIESLVGGNSLRAVLTASVIGAFMYFATLTEIPILQGLIGAGMGKGPALALLLAGPALSLPSMLVIRSVIGTKKTAVYVLLVIAMSTAAGMIYGKF
ncbi:permease [Geovibrio thiophilus]|uniref:Permease n=1 Tax=Geovibrio thiophilus TaxID=139438 RepID=A0A410JYZ7_9BACT|nr:permease [Geovibrio thiophilus]QAR33397.1 permease [Geovibrio thiophilus]